jgi:hypothetical protein
VAMVLTISSSFIIGAGLKKRSAAT